MDFEPIRQQYLQGAGSYRTLADKFGVPYAALCTVAKREGWAKEKRQRQQAYPSGEEVFKTARCLLAKMFSQIESAPRIESGACKQYTSALKDLRDIMGCLTLAQQEEFALKLDNLRQKNQKSDTLRQIRLVVEGGEEEWTQ